MTRPQQHPPAQGEATAAGSAPWFLDEAVERGIEFTWESGRSGDFHLPEITGGGVALFDMDGDEDLDLYFVQGGGPVPVTKEAREDDGARSSNQLYRNDDGVFVNVTAGSGADDTGYGMGVAAGDYDNDGDIDLYVTNLGTNVLLRNDGTGHFQDVTAESGVGDELWGASAAWLDYDRDGDLDLYVLNYINWEPRKCLNSLNQPGYCSPGTFGRPAGDVLYRNKGDGRFEDVTREAGISAARGNGMGIGCADFTGNGFVDIFIANDGMPDQLWVNGGDGTFRDEAMMMGCAVDDDGKAKAGMGVAVGDVDDDGDQDILVCNLRRETDSFHENRGTYFTDRTGPSGLRQTTRPYTRFGMGLLDFDNDGLLDLFQANGDISWSKGNVDGFAQPNMLLRGTSSGRFEVVSLQSASTARISRGAAFGDIDGDGNIDMVVVNMDAPAAVMMNQVGRGGPGAVRVRLLDANGRPAHGAILSGRLGERSVTITMQPAYSYLASNEPIVHVGLGAVTSLDDVQVTWPDGTATRIDSLDAGNHVIRQQ